MSISNRRRPSTAPAARSSPPVHTLSKEEMGNADDLGLFGEQTLPRGRYAPVDARRQYDFGRGVNVSHSHSALRPNRLNPTPRRRCHCRLARRSSATRRPVKANHPASGQCAPARDFVRKLRATNNRMAIVPNGFQVNLFAARRALPRWGKAAHTGRNE
jgi:hypothetical protein